MAASAVNDRPYPFHSRVSSITTQRLNFLLLFLLQSNLDYRLPSHVRSLLHLCNKCVPLTTKLLPPREIIRNAISRKTEIALYLLDYFPTIDLICPLIKLPATLALSNRLYFGYRIHPSTRNSRMLDIQCQLTPPLPPNSFPLSILLTKNLSSPPLFLSSFNFSLSNFLFCVPSSFPFSHLHPSHTAFHHNLTTSHYHIFRI